MSETLEIFGTPVRVVDLPEGLEIVCYSQDGKQAVVLTSDGKIHGPLWRDAEGNWQKDNPAP